MIVKNQLSDGRIEVTSTDGFVDIGSGPVKTLVVMPDEVEYVSEVPKEKNNT